MADQLSKHAVVNSDLRHAPVDITPFFRLVHVENPGAAFSILADAGSWGRWLLSAFAAAVSAAIAAWIWRRPPPLESAALSLVLGGALGNLIDRLLRGSVTDFLDFHWGGLHWPAFNVADSAITLGAVLIVFSLLKKK